MNKVILIGNLTRDVELRSTQSGVPVANFPIAVNRRFKDKDGEQETDFFNIIAWRQLGETCAKFLAKGRKVCVVGEIHNRSYEAKDGTKRSATDIIADEVEFLTPRDKNESGNENTAKTSTPPPARDDFFGIDDDDLPF
jgi:single-strand DNA-binding protein